MRLKKIEIFGFKSFADKTEIDFDQGVTCIVGPNGCGKSNISDSIRWVLGERSAKLLRGAKMEDVIFNGTDFRKPLALAEVSLTIDNTDRGLAIDYNEVTLTRRLYRSGESEYLINKTVCRLKDLQDLILDTGIGSSSYSMIEQGRIDYILNADADERRFLIEEAAGISKYKVKKEEAIRKLEKTEENRLRLNDIITEVHRNIQYAERQAKRAQRYQELYEKLKTMELKKAFYDLHLLTDERTKIEEEQKSIAGKLEEFNRQMETHKAEQDRLSECLRGVLDRYSEEDSRRYAIQSKIEHMEQLLQFHQEKRVEIAQRRGQIEQELTQLTEQIQKNAQEIQQKQSEINDLLTDFNRATEDHAQSRNTLQSIEEGLRTSKENTERLKREIFEAASATSRLRNELHRIHVFIETNQEQKRHRDANSQRLSAEADQWKSKEVSCLQELAQITEKLESLKQEKTSLAETLRQTQASIESKSSELQSLLRDCQEKEVRLKMLEEVEALGQQSEDELIQPDADSEFQEHLALKVREIFTVQPGYEWALDAVLDTLIRGFIAKDIARAHQLLARIQNKKPSHAGFMVAGEQGSADLQTEVFEHPLISKRLNEVVQIRPGYESLLRPLLNQTYIIQPTQAETILTELLPLSKNRRFIFEDGIILGPHQAVHYRNRNPLTENSVLERSAEMNDLAQGISQAGGRIQLLKSEIDDLNALHLTQTDSHQKLESQILDATIQKEAYDNLRQGMGERIGSYQRELELIYLETQQIQSQREEAQQKKAETETALTEAELKENHLKSEQLRVVNETEVLDQNKAEAMKRFTEASVRLESMDEKRRIHTTALSLLEEGDNRDKKRVEMLQNELRQLGDREAQLNEEDAKLKMNLSEAETGRRNSEVALELIRQEKEKAETSLSETQAVLEEVRKTHQSILDQNHDFEMKLMDINYQDKNIGERLNQAYRIQLSNFNPENYPMDQPLETISAELTELREKVEKLGAVNLLAIEEYDELKKRYEFLMTQHKDLEDAKEQLLETIRKINRTTKGLFEETFAKVQENFQSYYQTLFQGGSAKLVLVDESNPLESGIDIIVRPPAKKVTHITLLSGGEKAMTAIALLFALFKIKPSPFCVLDEVDAPLDEANIDRFLAVLDQFLSSSQFIIVTHNRKTISMGDSLFGVTMQEPGCSKVVSVKVNANSPEKNQGKEVVLLDELIPEKKGHSAEEIKI